MSRTSDTVTNIAMVVMSIAVTVSAGSLAWRSYSAEPRNSAKWGPGSPGATPYKVGEKFDLPIGVDFAKADETLLLVVARGCHFCAESMPFYRRILEQRTPDRRFQVVAALPEPAESGRAYLVSQGLDVDSVVSLPAGPTRFQGTPTLIAVGKNGKVAGVWLGKLQPPQEKVVIAALIQAPKQVGSD